ncbi:GGDEF domain-containing protein [Roseibium polysiphoniae]|uniref:GGDEF domain-containing protein n=1 Tax=Roseibium polysiphoniae TaxID=2571221 RepID=A0A944CAL4_9HYPH|nr:GGDEF domain-containing protein [Roseibium polysiphoniae]MBS8258829.1 GGDEF domain-containing protein [Roseibium polysiphoniae]
MKLDTPTLLMAVTIAYYTGALILAVLALSLRSFPRHIRLGWGFWAFAMLLSGSCATLVSMRGSISDLLSIALANALMLFGFGLRPNALSMLNRDQVSYPWLPFLLSFGWLGLYLVPWFRDDLLARTLYVNLASMLAMGLCIRQCWQALKTQKISSLLLMAVFTLDIFVRANLIMMHLGRTFPDLQASFQTTTLQLTIIVLIIAVVLKILGLGIAVFEQMTGTFAQQALIDPLTGLSNRRAFVSATEDRLAKMDTPAAPYALMVLEIDDLQGIKDRYGNAMNDALLRLLGRICSETAKTAPEACRLRDDQFALFLPGVAQVEADAIATRLSRYLTVEGARASDKQLVVTMSIGLFCGNASVPLSRALEIADHCLHRAKSKGGNQTVFNSGDSEGPVKSAAMAAPFATRKKTVA